MVKGLKILLFVLFVFKFGVYGNSKVNHNDDALNFDSINKECLQEYSSVLPVNVSDIEEDEFCISPSFKWHSYLRILFSAEGASTFNYTLISSANFFYSGDSSPPEFS